MLCFVESSVHFLSPVSSICVQILPATRPYVTASRCVSGELDVPDYCFFPPKIHHKSSVIKLCSEQLNCSKRSLNKSDDAAEEFFKTGKLFQNDDHSVVPPQWEKTSHDIFELISQVDSHRGIYVSAS